ncbi:MAG: cytochrome D1 domain-containing protein [Henriciella sp.]
MIQKTFRQMCLAAACFGLAAVGISACSGANEEARAPAKVKNSGSFEREGLKVDFSIVSVQNDDGNVVESEMTRIAFNIHDADTGEPVSGLYPAAWIDPVASADDITEKQCRQKAGTYLSGYIGVRPMIDLNSYYVVVLNSDPTIAVIDPIVGIKGITKLLTQIILPARGTDWTPSADQKRVYVAMPSIDSVAVVDLDTFRLEATVNVGDQPDRIATQPDGRYVWFGRTGDKSGVSVIDTETSKSVAEIETGEGHHEMAFSDDNRFAFISNRQSRTVSVVDIRTLKLVDEITIEGAPISVAYSSLSEAIYVADGVSGTVTAYDPETRAPRGSVALAPGLGPMQVTPDGRYAFVTNATENAVFILDTATNSLVHEIAIDGKPFQVSFSRNFAFLRALETARVSMIKLSEIGGGAAPVAMGFAAGERPPQDSPTLLPASMFASAVTEAATLAVSPGDATIYYYMEGMNAPMGNFRNYGHRPLAAMVADRTIREVAPGEYVSLVKMPAAGQFVIFMTMD